MNVWIDPMSKDLDVRSVETPSGILTGLQDSFVDAYVENGGNALQATKTAGYSETSARGLAGKLMKDPKILQEIYRRTVSRMAVLAPGALAKVQKLSENARSEYVQLEASRDLLDRAGMKAPDRVDHRVAGDVRVTIDLS